VARYFAYTIDGGLHPETFDITFLCKLVIDNTMSVKGEEVSVCICVTQVHRKQSTM
jgi:hypothetical protein